MLGIWPTMLTKYGQPLHRECSQAEGFPERGFVWQGSHYIMFSRMIRPESYQNRLVEHSAFQRDVTKHSIARTLERRTR
jgi:hypothetical protein